MEKTIPQLPSVPLDRHNRRLARWGENTAADYLKTKGYNIIGQNLHYSVGEIDIIAVTPTGEIVFVEVKTRSTPDFGGAEAVNHIKLHKLRKAAYRWLANKPYMAVRFDVIIIAVTNRSGHDTVTLTWHKGVDSGAC